MTGDRSAIGQDELHAFVDGVLPEERRSAVQAWLADNPDAAEEVRAYRRLNEGLHALFDPVLQEPLPAGLEAAARPRNARSPLLRIAAAVLLLLAGGLAGWLARDVHEAIEGPVTTLASESFQAHRVFTVEVRHPVEVQANEEQHLVRWLTKRLGAEVRAPHLRPLGFSLVGGRLLSSDEGPAAQLMYEAEDGRRLTIYLRANVDGVETAFRVRTAGPLSGFYWLEPNLAYAIVAELPRERLEVIARAVYEQLEN